MSGLMGMSATKSRELMAGELPWRIARVPVFFVSLRQMVAELGLRSLRDKVPTTYLLMEPRAGLGAQKSTSVFVCVTCTALASLWGHAKQVHNLGDRISPYPSTLHGESFVGQGRWFWKLGFAEASREALDGRRNLEEEGEGEGRRPLYSWAGPMALLRVNTSLSSQAWLSRDKPHLLSSSPLFRYPGNRKQTGRAEGGPVWSGLVGKALNPIPAFFPCLSLPLPLWQLFRAWQARGHPGG